jgi:hypothetical protein
MTSKRGALVRNPRRDYTHPESGLQVRSWGMAEYHPSVQRYRTSGVLDELDGNDVVQRRLYQRPMTLRYFHRYEMEHMLARCGFEIEAMYGDLRKGEYRSTSPDMIWVARRPEE